MRQLIYECIFRREVESPPTTTTTTTVATTTAKKRSTSAAEVNVTTSTPTTVTTTEQDFSSMMLLQVLDETGYMSDDVKMTDSIRLKVQALTTLGIICSIYIIF